jgi:hypothetical protein
MAAISRIEVELKTGKIPNAGTDGEIYLGICGREFYLDRANVDDFEQGDKGLYIFGGRAANTVNKEENDPTEPQLDTVNLPQFPSPKNLDEFPVCLRLEPRGPGPDWNIETIAVRVFVENDMVNEFTRGFGRTGLWLGQKSGKICYIGSGLSRI